LIVTDSQGEGKPLALFVVSLETGERKQLTHPQPPVFGDSHPAVSPDGRSLVFQRNRSGPGAELYSVPLGNHLSVSGEPKRLTLPTENAIHPAWMPGGKEILFSARRSIWKLAVTGTGAPVRLPFVGEDGMMPIVSRPLSGQPARLIYVRGFTDRNI